MPRPFRTKEWQNKRKEFLEGKVCEWCGSTEALSIHHKVKHPPFIQDVNKVSREMEAQKIREGEFHSQYPHSYSLSHEDFKVFWAKYGAQVTEEVKKQRESIDKEYWSLENCEVLCKKCHFAKEKGWLLCPVCKSHYMTRRNTKCRECSMAPYQHPWCQRQFKYDSRYSVSPRDFCRQCSERNPFCQIELQHCNDPDYDDYDDDDE